MVAALLVAACGLEAQVDAGSPATASTTTEAVTPEVPEQLEGLELAQIEIAGEPWLVAVADTSAAQRQGLMEVTDLGDLDGMLFAYTTEHHTVFTMRNTLIDLDVAFFDGDGEFIGLHTMMPCQEEPCQQYPSPGPFQWAVEGEAGSLQHLAEGDRLVIP